MLVRQAVYLELRRRGIRSVVAWAAAGRWAPDRPDGFTLDCIARGLRYLGW